MELHVVHREVGVAQQAQGVLILSKQAILPVARPAQWQPLVQTSDAAKQQLAAGANQEQLAEDGLGFQVTDRQARVAWPSRGT